jgi:hypothetical protein
MNGRRAGAALIALACFASSLFMCLWFWSLSTCVGAWAGLSRFREAYERAQSMRLIIAIIWLACQVLGGVAGSYALDLEEGTVRSCARRTPQFTLAFFAVTTAGTFLGLFLFGLIYRR